MLMTLVIWSSGISVLVMSIWCTGCVTSRTMCRSSKPRGEAVERDGHRALERVLDGDDAQRDLAALHGAEDVADGGIREGVQAAVGHVGEEGFLGERAFGAQEGHLVAGLCHAAISSFRWSARTR